ncbi:MAG: hypothetical protein IJS90_03605 [Clostridia bacterium]|nr:hypothetical protein [Clostridia bacterium]
MGFLENELKGRALPPLKNKEEMKKILLREEYGFLPETDFSISVTEPQVIERRLSLGEMSLSKVDLTINTQNGSHTFPVHRLLNHDGKKHPLIVFMDFSREAPSLYFNVELISETGVNVLSFCYNDVSSDNGDFENGLAKILLPEGQKDGCTAGKIMIWSFAASRVLDYGETLENVDFERVGVLGHSRLGKTALVTGMLDERFTHVFSNNAGCAGDAIAHGSLGVTGKTGIQGKPGERISDITRNFPFWFCKNYAKYAEKNYSDEFDQHFLLATIAPRKVHVSSSELDDWADPLSQKLCCLAASKAWEEYGKPGLIYNDVAPSAGDDALGGFVNYHCLAGYHYLSYKDWMKFIDTING